MTSELVDGGEMRQSGDCGGVPSQCSCGGKLKGHGRRSRWVISFEGARRVLVRRVICKACGQTISLWPSFLYPYYQCARSLVQKIKALWCNGLHAMMDVRYMLASQWPELKLALPTMYRWARLPTG
jgi:hypothetical protein